MKYIFFIIIYFINPSTLVWASEKPPQYCNAPILDKFTYQEFTKEEIIEFSDWICNLYQQNAVGKSLLDTVNNLLKTNKIIVKHGSETSFVYKNNSIEVNFPQLQHIKTPCIGQKTTLNPLSTNPTKNLDVYEIGVCMDFPENVIGHELLHMLHFLKNKTEYLDFIKEDPSNRFWINGKDPEIERRLWRTTEEKRTVLGDPREANPYYLLFSEFETRAAWVDDSMNLPPRYAYQASDQCFYEEASIIEELLKEHWKQSWRTRLEFLHHQKPFESFTFDKERAQATLLNRFKNKDYFNIQKTDEMKVLSFPTSKSSIGLNSEILKQVCNFKTTPPQENYLTTAQHLHKEKKYFEAANMIIQGARTGEKTSLEYLFDKKYITETEFTNFQNLDLMRLIQIKGAILEKWKPRNLRLSDLDFIKFKTAEVIKLCK